MTAFSVRMFKEIKLRILKVKTGQEGIMIFICTFYVPRSILYQLLVGHETQGRAF
jgi:hypothetical protein